MHNAPLKFVEGVLGTAIPTGTLTVLEIGSYDVNGSIREVVRQSPAGNRLQEYIGADLTEGPGVDIIVSGSDLDFEGGRFDLTLSLECFEHNPFWKETLHNMVRMLKPGGWCIITCASVGRPEHGTARMDSTNSPGTQDIGWNHYQNISLADFEAAISLKDVFSFHVLAYGTAGNDLYFVGRKLGIGSNLDVTPNFEQTWREASVCKERPNLKRRATYFIERYLGSLIFQSFYVMVWRTIKPR